MSNIEMAPEELLDVSRAQMKLLVKLADGAILRILKSGRVRISVGRSFEGVICHPTALIANGWLERLPERGNMIEYKINDAGRKALREVDAVTHLKEKRSIQRRQIQEKYGVNF